jgi:lysozyme
MPEASLPSSPDKEKIQVSRKINQKGLDLIKQFEGLELEAYPDPGTGGEPWTIGYGHTSPGKVKKGDKITEQEAEELLVKDIARFEDGVNQLVRQPISLNQFSALVSFSFNVGLWNLKSSTMLALVNTNKLPEAALQFERWNKAAGKVLPGLVKRRKAEVALFLLPD